LRELLLRHLIDGMPRCDVRDFMPEHAGELRFRREEIDQARVM
jgi:hypothetical protein